VELNEMVQSAIVGHGEMENFVNQDWGVYFDIFSLGAGSVN